MYFIEDKCMLKVIVCIVDIRGAEYPVPYFTTKVKVRWDDQRLYVGARMRETHFWGNFTQDESPRMKIVFTFAIINFTFSTLPIMIDYL